MRTERPIVTGIYLLFLRHELVYVGRSTDCYRRVAEHRSHGRAFDHSLITACPATDVRWVEEALIRAWGPVQNRYVKANGEAGSVVVLRPDAAPLVMAVGPARSRAASCGGSHADFAAAIASGALPTFPKNRHRTGKGSTYLIRLKDLDAWCEAQQATRLAS